MVASSRRSHRRVGAVVVGGIPLTYAGSHQGTTTHYRDPI